MNSRDEGPLLKTGRAFVYGNDINTDVLAPGAYLKFSVEEQAKHCLKAIDPTFVSTVKPDDVVVGGENFGVGSSREQAAISLVMLGVRYVIAKNFSRIFYRNAFNVGLIPLVSEEVEKINSGDNLLIDPFAGNEENEINAEFAKLVIAPRPRVRNLVSPANRGSRTYLTLALLNPTHHTSPLV